MGSHSNALGRTQKPAVAAGMAAAASATVRDLGTQLGSVIYSGQSEGGVLTVFALPSLSRLSHLTPSAFC